MHPEVADRVRAAIELRYRLLPYLYTCLWQSVEHHEPMLRPTFLDHPTDEQCYEDCDDFMLGPSLLVASVVEPEQTTRRVYLPDNGVGWWDYGGLEWYAGGQFVDIAVGLDSIPLFVRAGTCLPESPGATRATAQADRVRELKVYPLMAPGSQQSWLYEDDGESENAPFSLLGFDVTLQGNDHVLAMQQFGQADPVVPIATLVLAGELKGIAIGPDWHPAGSQISFTSR